MTYGDKRDYPKIDIYVRGSKQYGPAYADNYCYARSTTWAKTCREAVEQYLKAHPDVEASNVKAHFDAAH
jgi:hypothetical protein